MKNKILLNKFLLIVGFGIIVLLLTIISIKQNLSSKIGIEQFLIKVEGPANDITKIGFFSPTGGIIDIDEVSPNVYGFLLGNKKAIKEIVVDAQNVENFVFSYNTDGVLKKWEKFESQQLQYGLNSVAITTQHKSLFSYYTNTLNWKGDIFLIGLAFFNSCFIVLVLSIFILKIGKIKILLSVLIKSISSIKSYFWYALPVIILGIYLNQKNSSYYVLTFRHKDELSIIELFLEELPKFWNGFYGSMYNLLQLLFSIPGLVFDDFKMIAIGQRMISVTFASVLVITCTRYFKSLFTGKSTFFYFLLLISVPAFWINLNVARPDMPMTAAVLLSFIFILKDSNKLSTYYYLSLAMFCFAMAIKVHTAMYIPVFVLYLLLNFRVLNWKIVLNSGILFTIGILILNFEYLSIASLYELYHQWNYQMKGNSEGYGLMTNHITINQKLNVMRNLYFPKIILGLILVAHFYVLYLWWRDNKHKSILAITTGNLIVIIYHLIFVNKDWQNYYLPFMVIGLFIFFYALGHLIRYQSILIIVLLALFTYQAFTYQSTYKKINVDYYMPDKYVYDLQMETGNYVANYLSKVESQKTLKILYSNLLAIDKEKIKSIHQVELIPIKPLERDLKLLQKDYYYKDLDFILVAKYKSEPNKVLFEIVEDMMKSNNATIIFENDLAKFYKMPK